MAAVDPACRLGVFYLEGGSRLAARPSGTEPKIKFYVLTREPADDLTLAKQRATARINAVTDDLLHRADV